MNKAIRDNKAVAETLHRVETEIKDSELETLVVVDCNGMEVYRDTGKKSSVSAPVADVIKDNILTHNHPNGLCFFSIADVEITVNNDGEEIRAVTADGRFVSLKREVRGWNQSFLRWYAHNYNTAVSDDVFVIAYKRYGLGSSDRQICEVREDIANTWLRENQYKYGYTFTEGRI